MSFLNGSKGSKNRNNENRNDGSQEKCQWDSGEKQNSSHFIRNGMRKDAFLAHHQSRYLVDDFNGNNRSAPDPQPFWKCQSRYQFKAATNHEDQICQTIQQCPRFAFEVEFPGKIAIQYIANATNEKDHPERRGLDFEKQQANGP